MKQLLKHCDILASDGDGYKWLKNAYLGIDGDTIDYIGEKAPDAAYDTEKDMKDMLIRCSSDLSIMTCIHCLKHINAFRSTDFSYNNSIGAHSQSIYY